MRTPPTSGWLNRDFAITLTMIAAVMIVGFVILAIEATTEPYHIDELRQVSYYSQPLDGVIESSFGMEQPPLDMAINSQVQRVIGVGDLRQRAVSISLGAASIGLVGILALLAGLGRWGAVATAAALAFSPTTISTTAYARPYALPTFLMLAFLVVTIMWLRTGAISWAFLLVANAVLLLLSRPTEPFLFLLVVPGTLLMWQFVARGYRWPRVGYVVAASVGALVLVGRPILAEICQHVDQCRTVDVSVLSQVTRLWTDAPAVVVDALWHPWMLLVATAVFFAVGRSRNLLASQWWFWALAITAAAATAAFFVLSDPELGFSAKYTYLYFPIFSLMLGALVDATVTGARDSGLRSVGTIASGTISILVFVALATSAWTLVTTESRVDYAELATMALAEAPDRTIITDSPRDLGRWRPWMYGRGRYYPDDAPFVRVDDVVYNPHDPRHRHPRIVPSDRCNQLRRAAAVRRVRNTQWHSRARSGRRTRA
jgi:hypothetical protein